MNKLKPINDDGVRIALLEQSVHHISDSLNRLETNLTVQFANLRADIKDVNTSLTAKIESVNTNLTAKIENEIKTVNAKITENSVRIESVNTNLNSKIETLNTNFTTKIESVNTDLNAKIESLNTNLTARIEKLQADGWSQFRWMLVFLLAVLTSPFWHEAIQFLISLKGKP